MSNLVTSESFSDDAMSIEYEDDDGAAAGDAAVGPHDDIEDIVYIAIGHVSL